MTRILFFLIIYFSLIIKINVVYANEQELQKFAKTITEKITNIEQSKIALIFQTKDKESTKTKINLIKLKKDIAISFLNEAIVIDPIIVQKILQLNKVDAELLKNSSDLLSDFCSRAESNAVIFLSISLIDDVISIQTNASNCSLTSYGNFELIIEANSYLLEKSSNNNYTYNVSPKESINQLKKEVRSYFSKDQNNSWLLFNPTGYLIPEEQSIEINLWLKNLSNSELLINFFRYDYRWKRVQFGLLSNGNKNGAHHSSYGYTKLNFLTEDDFSFEASVGLRQRLYWNEENFEFDEEFDEDDENSVIELDETEKENEERNRQTLFISVSGEIDKLNLLYSVYLDNQTVGTGVKYFLSEKFNFFFDSTYRYYEKARVLFDFAPGIEVISDNIAMRLSYRIEEEQTLLGTQVDW